jgi:Asp-tRNA(Asn)/Glu-tRNA(Gln) amidotransferase A subunit family amidase
MTKRPANELSALQALAEIEAGRLTAAKLTEACLERIAAREDLVGAWQFIDPDRARAAARAVDVSTAHGALRGLPVAVKDLFDTADMPTTYGSPIYKDYRPAADASTVAQVRTAGGILLGKTVTTEFAYFDPGKTANPHDPSRTPGGSSSGSAAAVADFMAPLAFGTQTVGSTIRPASYCGVVGYKPSFGLIDRTGVRPLADVFDTVGLFARNVGDVAYFASVLSRRPNLRLNGKPDTPPRIGLCRTPEWPAAEPDSQAALETAANLSAQAGAKIREIELPEVFARVGQAQGTVVDYQAATSAAYELAFRRDQVSDAYLRRAEAGMACSPEQYDAALAVLENARQTFGEVMTDIDVLLMPSAPGEAPKGLQATGNPVFNRLGTALRVPCLSVPGLRGASGMPVGVQLIGRMGDDRRVLAAGAWLFRVLNG